MVPEIKKNSTALAFLLPVHASPPRPHNVGLITIQRYPTTLYNGSLDDYPAESRYSSINNTRWSIVQQQPQSWISIRWSTSSLKLNLPQPHPAMPATRRAHPPSAEREMTMQPPAPPPLLPTQHQHRPRRHPLQRQSKKMSHSPTSHEATP